MPSSYTTSLRLTLPATGELAGQWGNTVNTGITELLDAAVAGTASISTWGGAGVAYTLSNNSGTADEARKMFIVATGSPGEAKNVICPAVSKFYVFRNDTTGGFALTLKTSGGTGIAVPAGQYKFLYCDGTNVVEMFNSAGALTLSGALSVGGTATFAANPTLSAGAANGVTYLNGSKVLTSGSALTFDGTNFTLGTPTPSGGFRFTQLVPTSASPINAFRVTNGSDATFDALLQTNLTTIGAGVGALAFIQNSTEGMRLTSTGLGIGTSSPGGKLEVYAGASGATAFSNGANFIVQNSSAVGMSLLSPDANAARIYFGTASNNRNAFIYSDYNGGAQTLLFGVGTSTTAATEKMRLDSPGNLGLGATPSAWDVFKAVQVQQGSISSSANAANNTVIGSNVYYNAGWKYVAASARATMYQQDTGAHSWHTTGTTTGSAGGAASLTQAMTLDASGNLLVGGTAQLYGAAGRGLIQVSGSSQALLGFGTTGNVGLGFLYHTGTNFELTNAQNGYLSFGTNNTEQMRITSGGDLLVGLTTGAKFSVSYGGNDTHFGLGANYDNYITAGSSGVTIFRNTSTERARITSGGDLLVGDTATSAGARLYVKGSGTTNVVARFYNPDLTDGNPTLYVDKPSTTTTTSQMFIGFTVNAQTAGSGQINANGASQAAFGSFSDRRLKENIVDLPPQLDNILALRPVEFDYIESEGGGHQVSFIAQEFEEVYPDAVGARSDGMKTLTGWGKTEARLVKAIQEQQALITALTARVAALEAQP